MFDHEHKRLLVAVFDQNMVQSKELFPCAGSMEHIDAVLHRFGAGNQRCNHQAHRTGVGGCSCASAPRNRGNIVNEYIAGREQPGIEAPTQQLLAGQPGRGDCGRGGKPTRLQFAFYGRVSTEDHQDPVASRAWQLRRAHGLIDPAGGVIVAEFFDVDKSRSVPWQRRPQASALLGELRTPARDFDAVVVGEPHRAFYGNQYSLTFPLFEHFGVPTPSGSRAQDLRRSFQWSPSASFPRATTVYSPARTDSHQQQRRHSPDTPPRWCDQRIPQCRIAITTSEAARSPRSKPESEY